MQKECKIAFWLFPKQVQLQISGKVETEKLIKERELSFFDFSSLKSRNGWQEIEGKNRIVSRFLGISLNAVFRSLSVMSIQR